MRAQHPQSGRPAEQGLRARVASRGRSGYRVLYDYDAGANRVLLRAVRQQRAAGYLEHE